MSTTEQLPHPRNKPVSLVREGLRGVRETQVVALPQDRLRMLSFNIQAGIGTSKFSEYFTGSWKHLVAAPTSVENLQRISQVIRDYDLVALQEVDGGSLRSRFLNQLSHLADQAGFPFWHQQLNRNLGKLGQFSNGLLSRPIPYAVEDHRLPGLPGRGAFIVKYGHPEMPLVVVGVHLALGGRYRNAQLFYLAQLLKRYPYVVIMGDFNCLPDELLRSPISELDIRLMDGEHRTYPSWAPEKHLDHILVSRDLETAQTGVLDQCLLSDHLPVATEIIVPEAVRDAAAELPRRS
ncbi:endonuclease/exonuclease/phosphatase family protein [Isoalcanivorax beigongshangi]|uniref:Endonuclease/exonuclease/phosphatase family protein n=1 Tax=Isoalcanivorax beigongshangi TaxID=3238810 RepID=A0ABV4AFD4_9GAMM